MYKQVIFPILGVIAFIVILGLYLQKNNSQGMSGVFGPQPTTSLRKTIKINSAKINVQIADTQGKRVAGLSGVSSLAGDSGMLFIFDTKKVKTAFWMKGMLIPLDMIWIADGKIVKIDKNIPVPAKGTADGNLETYSAGQPIDYVLEVNAGFSDKNKIKVGDSVDLSGI